MQNDKLLNCPFCGCKANIFWEPWKDISEESGVYRLQARHEKECFFVRMNGTNTTSEMIGGSEEILINTWNTRKPMQRIVEQLEDKKAEYLEGFRIHKENELYGIACGFGDAINIVKGGVDNAGRFD